MTENQEQLPPKGRTNNFSDVVSKLVEKGQTVSQARNEIARIMKNPISRMIVAKERKAKQEAEYAANHDALTGLYNRHWLSTNLPGIVEVSQKNKAPLSILQIDLDHFKAVNDGEGHAAGDKVLQIFADIFKRQSDTVARTGGDEFVVVLGDTPTEVKNEEGNLVGGATFLTQKIYDEIGKTDWSFLPSEIRPTCSIGVVSYPLGEKTTQEEVLKRADDAAYDAKAQGRGRAVVWNESISQKGSPATMPIVSSPK